MITTMSNRTADVLLGVVEVEAGELSRLVRHTEAAMATELRSRAEILAAIDWAMNALETYPSVPDLPELDFDLTLPA